MTSPVSRFLTKRNEESMMSDSKSNDIEDIGPFVLRGKGQATEIYSDGLSQFMLGYPLSRLVFHTVNEPATTERKEQRKANLVLTMPTQLLLEAAKLVMDSSAANKDTLLTMSTEQAEKLSATVAQLQQGTAKPN